MARRTSRWHQRDQTLILPLLMIVFLSLLAAILLTVPSLPAFTGYFIAP